MTKPNSITQDLDTKEAEATNPLVRFYIREIRKHAAAIDPNCEASSNALSEAVNSVQKAAQLESMRRAGIAIPAPDGQMMHDTLPKPKAAHVGAVGALVEPAKAGPVLTAPAQGNSTKTRRSDSIDPVIKLAKTKCVDPDETSEVWAQMQVLAQDEHPPFLASTELGLKYHKKGKEAYFTRDALDKRLHPEKRRTSPERRGPPRAAAERR